MMRSALTSQLFLYLVRILAPGLASAESLPDPPEPPYEFRAAWIATVRNLHWPSRPGLAPSAQQAELRRLFDAAAQSGLNAVILQVRPAGDAFYRSEIEPWSPYLTGQMGQPPEPFYDPLAFAVREAHARGLELHAWFNPFRVLVRVGATNPAVSSQHISRVRPEWVRSYGPYLWLDPGEPSVADYVIQIVLDVVRRYDIDGVHLDDYFYPYPERTNDQQLVPFPDDSSWDRHGRTAGLSRDDWRRRNVDGFVQRLYQAVKETRPTVRVGLSPFGIWRPDHPKGVRGLDAYNVLYADSRKWLQEGWLDYCAPQLYWPTTARDQPFADLLAWWHKQNRPRRHVWPGLNTARAMDWGADEIIQQVRFTRRTPSAGHIHWHLPALLQHTNLLWRLKHELYRDAALVPPLPDSTGPGPARPRLEVGTEPGASRVHLHWQPGDRTQVRFWYLQVLGPEGWQSRRLGSETRSWRVPQARIVCLRAVGPNGRAGPVVLWRRGSVASPKR
ncbi:MAG: family 10 glycosylhydrolase [Verrucomicrobiota bacterium]|nr:family 10 glycosylhydrolase [Limisphaera sp.]MDW8382519.1 family 10 glycosylhydrolase [Verrucomicrobiota bacterium]